MTSPSRTPAWHSQGWFQSNAYISKAPGWPGNTGCLEAAAQTLLWDRPGPKMCVQPIWERFEG